MLGCHSSIFRWLFSLLMSTRCIYVATYKWKYSKCLELYVNYASFICPSWPPNIWQTSIVQFNKHTIYWHNVCNSYTFERNFFFVVSHSWQPSNHFTCAWWLAVFNQSVHCVSQEVALNSMQSQRRLRSRRYIHICWIYYTFVWYIYGSFVLYSAMTVHRCVYDIQARGSRLSHLNFYLKISEKIRKYECAQLLPASI